jgi:prevent-host-death family protein
MTIVNMLEAKTTLSKLVDAVESGSEKEIIIARNGKPAARLVAIETEKPRIRLGLANGRYIIGELDPELDAEVARLFGVDE